MPIDDNTQKAILSLVSVIVGWFLGQGTNLSQKIWTNRRLKKALLAELEDLKVRLGLIARMYERKLQIFSLEGIETDVPLKLNNFFYKKHYPDIYDKLSRSQRSSYELIHGHVEALNQEIDNLSELLNKLSKEKVDDDLEEWGRVIQTQYIHIRTLYWHINYHLANEKDPDLGGFGTEGHKLYLKALEKSYEVTKSIMEKAKKLDRNNFMQIYREEDFTDLA